MPSAAPSEKSGRTCQRSRAKMPPKKSENASVMSKAGVRPNLAHESTIPAHMMKNCESFAISDRPNSNPPPPAHAHTRRPTDVR